MPKIQKVAVCGSGVMGAAIAAHIANSGTPVLLFDIVPNGAADRHQLPKDAIEKLLKTNPAALTHKRRAKLITPCNLEDDLDKLKEVDWIIEAIVEKIEVKQSLYKKLEQHRKPYSVVSSNTSTLPLHHLIAGMPDSFRRDFMITHFFNPPRYMRLLELVTTKENKPESVRAIHEFCDINLGKGVVICNDTPGFIANRIGCYWLTVGLNEAIRLGITVEEADAVMGKPVGIPKTGVFGLMDLIGIDLLPLIAKAFSQTLPESDSFRQNYKEIPLVMKMIADGYTGRKGKGGFYRLNTEGGGKKKESIDLKTGEYRAEKKATLESVEAAKNGLQTLVNHPDKGGQYARAVLLEVLRYAASLVPEISASVKDVDDAMKMGYNWKYGPFELIDRLGVEWFTKELGDKAPAILKNAKGQNFYKTADAAKQVLDPQGTYQKLPFDKTAWALSDIKLTQKPVIKGPTASLWDVGDGVFCLEFTGKMNTLDPTTMETIMASLEKVKKDGVAMIIGNDAENFSVGANLGFFLYAANLAAWNMLEDAIKGGQDTYMAIKYAPFPVVAAVAGMAFGGGCEMMLHCAAVQAHCESYPGLVEVGVGVIPGWGGCKELILRHAAARLESQKTVAKMGHMFSFLSPIKSLNAMPAVTGAFETIVMAKVGKSADDAKELLMFDKDKFRITMNRARLLADAKARALELAKGYVAPTSPVVALPGKTARVALDMAIRSFEKSGKASPHDATIAGHLANVLSGGNTDITKTLTEQQLLDLERQEFMQLVRLKPTLDRIEHMLETSKPLRN
jgi:3-hydroxyacyl-CoA dehydrogenase